MRPYQSDPDVDLLLPNSSFCLLPLLVPTQDELGRFRSGLANCELWINDDFTRFPFRTSTDPFQQCRGGGLALAPDRLADGRQSRVDVAAQIDAIKTNDR